MLSCSLNRDSDHCQALWGQAGLFQRKLTHRAETDCLQAFYMVNWTLFCREAKDWEMFL